MRSFLFRALIVATATLLTACSSTQFTLYKPSESEPGWRVTVVKEPIGKFVCSINDSVVVEESFRGFSNNFEKDGSYRGKKVKMGGYRTAHTSTGSGGQITSSHTYQIRVFIDDREIGKFDF